MNTPPPARRAYARGRDRWTRLEPTVSCARAVSRQQLAAALTAKHLVAILRNPGDIFSPRPCGYGICSFPCLNLHRARAIPCRRDHQPRGGARAHSPRHPAQERSARTLPHASHNGISKSMKGSSAKRRGALRLLARFWAPRELRCRQHKS